MKTLVELFDICANRLDYTTVRVDEKKFKRYEVDYKFEEDVANKTLYVYFEPSDGRTDWVVNFSYWRKPYKDMEVEYRVHGGFLASWKIIHDAIVSKITEKGENGDYCWQKIVSVGYSHGGPLAALCHECAWFERADLRDKDGALVGISFDGPRMYAGLWIKKELKERWRNFYVFRNHSDIVTHLPPVVFFFRHVGDKVYVGVGKNPGLIKAHYPERIKEGLEDFMKNGEMTIREKIKSILEVIIKTADTVENVLDRDVDIAGTYEKIESIGEKIEEVVKSSKEGD